MVTNPYFQANLQYTVCRVDLRPENTVHTVKVFEELAFLDFKIPKATEKYFFQTEDAGDRPEGEYDEFGFRVDTGIV